MIEIKDEHPARTSASIYRFEVDPEGDTAGANILRLVEHNKSVLEIGAGPGSIARPLTVHNQCRVTAIEIDQNCIPILEAFCERVIQADLNTPTWTARLGGAKFDVIVIADVLEHLVDPWTTLRQAVDLLQPHGHLVCSIPNASHSAILSCFATDDVEYREWGLLDRTHIRFFGVRNLQDLFRHAGLRIVDALYVVRPPEITEFAERWGALPRSTRRTLAAGPFSQVYQTVVKASIEANSERPEFILAKHPPRKQRARLFYRLAPPGTRLKIRNATINLVGERGWSRLKQIARM